MKLLLVGCEYSGTTTLALAINDWAQKELGSGFRLIHDHFKLPDTQYRHQANETLPHGSELTEEEILNWQALSPRMLEVIQRHNLYYHSPSESSSKGGNQMIIGLHIDDAVYGPLYYNYGHPGVAGDRTVIGKHIELNFMKFAPDTVMLHVKASPDVIRRRMNESPHKYPVVQEKDVEHVLHRFDEEVFNSLLKTIQLDTSTNTVEEVVEEFADKIQPLLSLEDRIAMWTHRNDSKGV